MNCLLRDLGARDLAAEHGEIRFISTLHADMIETILAAQKEYSFLLASAVHQLCISKTGQWLVFVYLFFGF